MTAWICVSVSEADSRWMAEDGPRRDYLGLAERVDGRLLFGGRTARSGLLTKLVGPHLRLAWRAARVCARGDVIYADGEHVGIPLLLFLALWRRAPARVVMLGHLPGPLWKRWALRIATRLGSSGVLLVHSAVQAALVRPVLGRRWRLRVVPYHADTAYWRPLGEPPARPRPLVLAVGSEHRDYETLARAAAGLEADVEIAAGSLWARRQQGAAQLPPNVRYLAESLHFRELRERYAEASVVVVPLQEMPNQFGLMAIMEGLAMGRPLVVTATSGQRETVRGPLVDASERLDAAATADRGPQLFGDPPDAAGDRPCGLYVPVGDSAALQAAIRRLLQDPGYARDLGEAGRICAEAHYRYERYVDTLAAALLGEEEQARA